MLSENVIQQVKELDLLDVVSTYTKLRRNGSEHVGLCPFHTERTPSFYVHPTKGFKCFGCGVGGNAVDFIMKAEDLPFADAIKFLAQRNGIFIDDTEPVEYKSTYKREPTMAPPIDYLPAFLIEPFEKSFRENHLFTFLANKKCTEKASSLFMLYGCGGCDKFGAGTTLFVQKDIDGNVRQAKAMLYNPITGKRRKDGDFTTYIGRTLLSKATGRDYQMLNLQQCFFGEHLLRGNNKPTALVESEKTAMIASLFYPQYIWIATGGINGVKWDDKDVCKVLTGRNIDLFPDVDAHKEWEVRADVLKLNTGSRVRVIDIMNGKPAPDGMQKYDIADLLIAKHFASASLLSDDDAIIMKQFDEWITSNPDGGIFEYSGGKLCVKPREQQTEK